MTDILIALLFVGFAALPGFLGAFPRQEAAVEAGRGLKPAHAGKERAAAATLASQN